MVVVDLGRDITRCDNELQRVVGKPSETKLILIPEEVGVPSIDAKPLLFFFLLVYQKKKVVHKVFIVGNNEW